MRSEIDQILDGVHAAFAAVAEAVELERQEHELSGAEPNAKTLEAYAILRDLLDRQTPNIPVECEDRECQGCTVGNEERVKIDCPGAVHDKHYIVVTVGGETVDDAGREVSNAQVIDFVEAKDAAEATDIARPDGAFHREMFVAYALADEGTTSHLSWTNRKWYSDRGLTPVNWPNAEGDDDDDLDEEDGDGQPE